VSSNPRSIYAVSAHFGSEVDDAVPRGKDGHGDYVYVDGTIRKRFKSQGRYCCHTQTAASARYSVAFAGHGTGTAALGI